MLTFKGVSAGNLQFGIVLDGEIEVPIGEEEKALGLLDIHFIPAGIRHH